MGGRLEGCRPGSVQQRSPLPWFETPAFAALRRAPHHEGDECGEWSACNS